MRPTSPSHDDRETRHAGAMSVRAASRQRPNHARDHALLACYARTRDPALRTALVERYLPLARHAASRRRTADEPLEDLMQVAAVRLLKAIDRYDPSRCRHFVSFAMPTMDGELLRYLHDLTWAIRPPRDLQDIALHVDRQTMALSARLGRSPTVQELAAELDIDEATVRAG
jgi:RNA polymerase sigma-B factor